MWHIWDTERVLTGFWRGDLMERDHLEDLGIDWTIILKWTFKKLVWGGAEWNDVS